MNNYLKSTASSEINIEHLWPALRQRQYYNAMHDLQQELEVLAALPSLDENLKIKVMRSLEKIQAITKKTIK